MCGIAGIFAPGASVDPECVRKMTDAVHHRGPDDAGLQALERGQLVLGHRRLAILDLSSLGHQPMASPDGQVWITYNGEIYNFREIRDELIGHGYSFASGSDTEVIIAAYQQWGLDCVKRFRGMFAFALWDSARRLLHLCRDRFGVKPLYFAIKGERLAFASETRSLNVAGLTDRAIDPMSMAEFVQYGYISAPRTSFADVESLAPGTILTFDVHLRRTEWRYWTAESLFEGPEADALRKELAGLPDAQVLDRMEQSLTQAFDYRMVADVPVGLFLSGGIDSSLVAALLAHRSGHTLKTFTIGYESSEFDETRYAQAVASALGTNHVELVVSTHQALDLVTRIPDVADEPIGDNSLIPTLLVSQLARKDVTVALSADGADELFGGYARYQFCGDFATRPAFLKGLYRLSADVLERLPPSVISRAYAAATRGGPRFAAINDKLRKFVRMAKTRDAYSAYEAATSEWSSRETAALVPGGGAFQDARPVFDRVRGADLREQFMHMDIARYLPGDLLTKVDRASMFVSLESREPFLDHEMARLAAALPMRWKIRDGQSKYVLRRLLDRHFPKGLFDRPKQGFAAPIGEWMRGPVRGLLTEALSETQVRRVGILDPKVAAKTVENFLSGNASAGSAPGVWTLLQLQEWASRWASPRASEPATAQRTAAESRAPASMRA